VFFLLRSSTQFHFPSWPAVRIVGDYRDPEKKKIVRPKRIGGDDDFLVRGAKNNLYEDIYNEMARSHLCNAYLAK
jgi:hypothetical protein